MKTKIVSVALSTLAFSATSMALDYTVDNIPDFVEIPSKPTNNMYTINLSAGEGVDLAKFDAAENANIFYLFTKEGAPNPDASYLIAYGANIIRTDANDAIVGLRTPSSEGGRDATMTFANGVYNLGTKTSDNSATSLSSHGLALSVWGANGESASTDKRAIVIDSDATLNVYATKLNLKTNTNTSVIFKGTVNVFNQAIASLNQYTTETPENPTYGRVIVVSSTSGIDGKGTIVVDGGTLNASEIYQAEDGSKMKVINAGKVNLYGDAVSLNVKDFTLGDNVTSTQETVKTAGALTIEGKNFTSLADSKIEANSLIIKATNANLAGTISVTEGDLSVEGENINLAGTISVAGRFSNGYAVNYNSSASITAGNFWTGENSNVLLNGSIKITSTASSDAFVVYKGSTLTFDESATLDLNGNARIEVRTNSTLIVKSAEKSIQTRHLWVSDGSRVELLAKEVFADNKGGDSVVLLTNNGGSHTLYVTETNSFGQTAIGKNTKLYLELDFASSDSYIDLGEIYATGNGYNLNLYVKNFENNRIKADSLRSGMGSTYLYLFDEASQKYVLNENAQWLGDATNGYWLTVAVPEPAEWAMILGALALGFAIYRKRK